MADRIKQKQLSRAKKRLHIRKSIRGTSERPRLVVFRSSKNIYAQLVDDLTQKTLAGVSTLSPDFKADASKKGKIDAAKAVGKGIAEKGKTLKIKRVVFDRGGYLYHGRVKAMAEAARENGLEF
jgi:large subunit ribosomal protein L18